MIRPPFIQVDAGARIDTGWDCCVCGTFATVMGDGFTWCLEHWDRYELGYGEKIKDMRAELKNDRRSNRV